MNIPSLTKALVARVLGLGKEDERQLHDGTDFILDLDADSLDCVELWMAVEEEFGLDLSDEDTESVKTVGDLVALIDLHMAEASD